MYRHGGDGSQFRPVPAAPPPPRVMGGPFFSTPPSLPPPGHPPLGPTQGWLPVMQQPPILQRYAYPPPAPQLPPPVLMPPPISLRSPVPPMHPSLPSMQSSIPTMQRPLPPSVRLNLPTSLPPPRPMVQQPPPPMQAGFQSMPPSLPLVSTPFQSSLVQVAPPMSFTPIPLPSFQPAQFLPPLPPSPPLENPPPPPPASPPPQSPSPTHVEESPSSKADLLPPEPPNPTDPEMLKNIDVLAAFVVKNGPRFESMARARQAGDPKFSFLFESDAAPEAAIGHEFYKWRKKCIALELGLEVGNKKNNQLDIGAVSGRSLHLKGTSLSPGDVPVSPAMSDMDMEDDFSCSPIKVPLRQPESGSLPNVKCCELYKIPTIDEGHVIQKDAAVQAKQMNAEASLSPPSFEKMSGSSLVKAEEQRLRDGSTFLNSRDHMDPRLHSFSNSSGTNALIDSQGRSKVTELSQDPESDRQEHRAARSSRWEAVPSSVLNQVHNEVEDIGDQNFEFFLNPTRESSSIVDQIDANGAESGKLAVQASQNGKTVTVDEYGRLVQKEAMESESEDDMRPRKRRRSYFKGRSRSRSRSRGKSRSRSRSGNMSRSRSRSQSYSPGETRGKRQAFSRSPPGRGRWSRSRSRSPHWHRNNSQSPPRNRWGGAARGDRDWRSEHESYGRGRRGSGPTVCFHYARGRCFRGSACKFLHPERETGQERGVQLADGLGAGFKTVEPTTSRPLVGADPVSYVVHGGKDECMGQGSVSIGDMTHASQAVHLVDIEEGKVQVEQPTLVKDSQALVCNSSSETIKQAEKIPGEYLETGSGADEPGKIAADNDNQGLVKSNSDVDESLEVESTNRDTDVNLKLNEESEKKGTEQIKDARKGVMSPELVTNVLIDSNTLKISADSKVSAIKTEILDSSSGFEEITAMGSGEGAIDNSEVAYDANSLRMPLISGALVQAGSVSPVELKVMTKSSYTPSPSRNENLSNERSFLVSKPLDPVHYTSPERSQISNPPSTSVSTRSPKSIQQMSISNPPIHGTLHNQSSHGAAFLPHRWPGDTARQESNMLPQDRLPPNFEMHDSGKFSSNQSKPQQLGNRPHSTKEPWDARLSLSKEESTYSRLMDNNTRQYSPMSDVSQHLYPLSNIVTSTALIHKFLPWNMNASRSTVPSNPEHYSYTLTTIPPLRSLIKLPGGSTLPNSSEQYDPLSDGLELVPSGTSKFSSKPSGDGWSPRAGVLENVSPGLDAEKVTALALTTDVNEAAADVGVVENVSPPGEWSPVQPGDAATVAHDHSKSKKSNRGLKLLRTAVADRVKVLLKPAWKEGRLSKDTFKTIAKKAVEKVTGNLPSHHIPKSQEKVDQFMAVSGSKISKLVQGYIEKYSKV